MSGLHQAGLAPGGLVLVDDALGGGLVDALDRQAASSATSRRRPRPQSAGLVRVFSSERTALLRTRRFSFWRLRLIWLLMLATECPARRKLAASIAERDRRHASGLESGGNTRGEPLASNPARLVRPRRSL